MQPETLDTLAPYLALRTAPHTRNAFIRDRLREDPEEVAEAVALAAELGLSGDEPFCAEFYRQMSEALYPHDEERESEGPGADFDAVFGVDKMQPVCRDACRIIVRSEFFKLEPS